MLVLTRKIGESIVIDGNIKVTIVDVNGRRVRLAIEAPRAIPVLRDELAEFCEAGPREERISEWAPT